MGKVLRPQFEQFLHELRSGKPLGPKLVAESRSSIMGLLEGIPDLLVNKATVTGHPEMRLDFKCSWLGPDWDQGEIASTLLDRFPGDLFPSGSLESHIVEFEDEVVVLRFAAQLPDGFLAGRVRVLPS